MTIFDVILLLILAGFVFYGLFFGLIRTFGSLIGVVIGAWLASHWYLYLFRLIHDLFFGFDNLGKVLAFLVLFSLINRLVCFFFSLLDKAFDIISIIPFLKTINRLAGAFLGFIEGGIVLGLILFFIVHSSFVPNFLNELFKSSQIVPFLLKFINILLPLFPEALRIIKSAI